MPNFIISLGITRGPWGNFQDQARLYMSTIFLLNVSTSLGDAARDSYKNQECNLVYIRTL